MLLKLKDWVIYQMVNWIGHLGKRIRASEVKSFTLMNCALRQSGIDGLEVRRSKCWALDIVEL